MKSTVLGNFSTNHEPDIEKISYFFSMLIQNLLNNNKLVKVGEILLIFLLAFSFIKLLLPFSGGNLIAQQGIVWLANVLMLGMIFLGMRLRGEKLSHFGITFGSFTLKDAVKTLLLSLLVFVVALAAFVLGSIIMVNITDIPEGADFSNYDFLKDNLPMLFLTLFGVYIVSSFGEEVIYRAFLINRLTELGLEQRSGRIIVLLISSVIFGLVHYEWGPMGIVQTSFMGLALGFFYIRWNKKIWPLVLAHVYMDTILMVQMYMASNA